MGIFQSERLDPPRVVEVPQQLVVTCRFGGEGTVGYQFLGLFDTIGEEEFAEVEVEDCGGNVGVATEYGVGVSCG